MSRAPRRLFLDGAWAAVRALHVEGARPGDFYIDEATLSVDEEAARIKGMAKDRRLPEFAASCPVIGIVRVRLEIARYGDEDFLRSLAGEVKP